MSVHQLHSSNITNIPILQKKIFWCQYAIYKSNYDILFRSLSHCQEKEIGGTKGNTCQQSNNIRDISRETRISNLTSHVKPEYHTILECLDFHLNYHHDLWFFFSYGTWALIPFQSYQSNCMMISWPRWISYFWVDHQQKTPVVSLIVI